MDGFMVAVVLMEAEELAVSHKSLPGGGVVALLPIPLRWLLPRRRFLDAGVHFRLPLVVEEEDCVVS